MISSVFQWFLSLWQSAGFLWGMKVECGLPPARGIPNIIKCRKSLLAADVVKKQHLHDMARLEVILGRLYVKNMNLAPFAYTYAKRCAGQSLGFGLAQRLEAQRGSPEIFWLLVRTRVAKNLWASDWGMKDNIIVLKDS